MTVQVIRSTPKRVKPDLWPLEPNLVAPEGQWAWDLQPVRMYPVWLGAGSVVDLVEGNEGTLLNTISWHPTDRGVGLLSDDGGDLVDCGPTPITGSQNRTVAVFWRPTVTTEDPYSEDIVGIDEGGGVAGNGARWTFKRATFGTATGQLRIEIQGSGYSTSITPTLNEWHLSACILDGTTLGDHTIYHNGQTEQASGSGSVDTSPSANLKLAGGREDSGPDGSANQIYMGGDLGAVYIWPSAVDISLLDRLHRDPFAPFRPQRFRFFAEADDDDNVVNRTLQDSLAFNENLNRDFEGDRLLSDQTGFAENQTDAKETTKQASDDLGFAENLNRDGVFTRQISDDLTFTETLVIDRILTRIIQDELGFEENLMRTVTKSGAATVRRIQDTLDFAENLIRDVDLTRLMNDNLTFEENLNVLVNNSAVAEAVRRHWRYNRYQNLRRERPWSAEDDMWDA